MITVVNSGEFQLIETRRGVKVLRLNKANFVWLTVPKIGSILVRTNTNHKIFDVLSQGAFSIYRVKDEPNLVDLLHLELEVGDDIWQGYLLPTGLPTTRHKRRRIIPTHEVITTNPAYKALVRREV